MRWFWIAFGAVAQLAFVVMVPQLFLFLYRGGGNLLSLEPAAWQEPSAPDSLPLAVLIDVALLSQFALCHSVFLLPGVRDRLERWVPTELYGSLYTLVVSITALLVCWLWQPLPGVVYSTSGGMSWLLLGCFLGSWALLFYTISLTGLGWHTGLLPWWCYVRRRAVPRRGFVTTGMYRWLRHPVYVGFLGLIWFTPRMTSDHLLMACTWTVYVYTGSVLKDRRMLFYLGNRYSAYMEQVPGYPVFFWGPLARRETTGCLLFNKK